MPPELSLVDTNVLVYAVFQDAPQHAASRQLLEACQRGETPLCVAPQNLVEFYSTTTSPRRVTSPFKPVEALALIRQILAIPNMTVLPLPPDVHERWLVLMERNPIGGNRCFDVQLVATIWALGIRRVFTYNIDDFKMFAGVEPVKP